VLKFEVQEAVDDFESTIMRDLFTEANFFMNFSCISAANTSNAALSGFEKNGYLTAFNNIYEAQDDSNSCI
jgi:hypothetical protein